jgi:Holliday junction resolvasome RuvABC endonuclease subunit
MADMPALLAIDPGIPTGIAYSRADGVIRWRTWHLECTGGGRSLELRRLLNAVHTCESFDLVAYERPYQSSFIAAVRSLHHAEGEILSWSASCGLKCLGYTPREIKASIAGGRASKDEMMKMIRVLGYAIEDEHQADAVALLLLARTGVQPAQERREAGVKAAKKLRASDGDLVTLMQRRQPRRRAIPA